jgi:predicted nucleic acid-binding protein
MTRIFIDANVLVSVLNREYPKFRMSARVVSLADNPAYSLYTSSTCLAIAFYFASKRCKESVAFEKMRILCERLEIANSGKEEVLATLQNKKIKDFEDGIQHYAAVNSGCQYIITEDRNDFYFSEIPVMNCETFLRDVALPAVGKRPKKGY